MNNKSDSCDIVWWLVVVSVILLCTCDRVVRLFEYFRVLLGYRIEKGKLKVLMFIIRNIDFKLYNELKKKKKGMLIRLYLSIY